MSYRKMTLQSLFSKGSSFGYKGSRQDPKENNLMHQEVFFKNACKFYHRFSRHNTSAGMCSICAHMFIYNRRNGYSYVDKCPDTIHCTQYGYFIRINDKNYDIGRLENVLCYGSALFHTDRCVDRLGHMSTQYELFKDSFDILIEGKLNLFDKKPVIIYIKMNNGPMKAKNGPGIKVKHPHIWIMKQMPDYGKSYHTDEPDQNENHYDFIFNHLIFADALMDLYPDKDIYLKFLVGISPLVLVKKVEIDLHDPEKDEF